MAYFCPVGGPIGSDAGPTTTQAGGCDIAVHWGYVNRVEIGADGHMTISFGYQGAADTAGGEPGDAVHDGTCHATATTDGDHLHLVGLDCKPAAKDTNAVDASGLAEPTWKLDGSCLSIDESWFEQKSGECKDHSLEQKFNDVGNAIANAS